MSNRLINKQFAKFVSEIEARSGYTQPQAFGVGLATFQIGSLDEPTTIGDDATVLDTWFPAPNREENFGTAAVLANLVGHGGGSGSYRLDVADLERALATFAPFANDGKRHANVTALSQLRATLQRLERNRARYVNGEVGLDRVLPRSIVVTFIEDLAHEPVDAHDAYLRLHLLSTRKARASTYTCTPSTSSRE